MFHGVWAEDTCPAPDKFKYQSTELKLNLDGNGKPDVVAVFAAGEGDKACSRKALILDAPEPIPLPKPEQWLTPTYFSDPALSVNVMSSEKRTVGDRDLLYFTEEIGDYAAHSYYSADAGKFKRALVLSHNHFDGQISEKYDSKKQKLAVRIFNEGEFELDGTKVDLEQRALKARCRVRELYIELKYEWDRKDRKFKEVDQGCVMGSAID